MTERSRVPLAVTTSGKPEEPLIKRARESARAWKPPYLPRRRKEPIGPMLESTADALLVFEREGVVTLWDREGSFSVNPGMAHLRRLRILSGRWAETTPACAWPNSAREITSSIARCTYLRSLPSGSFDVVLFDPMFEKPKKSQPAFEMLRRFAEHAPLTPETLAEARSVARRWVVVKGSKYSDDLEKLGIEAEPGSRYTSVIWGRVAAAMSADTFA